MPDFNPQPGISWPPGKAYAEGFGGTIAAFNDLRVANNKAAKSYSSNWGGIVKAIMDLAEWGKADCGVYPTGWNVLTDSEGTVTGGEWITTPLDGHLWYDESSGRLMVWNDDAFYQANGADGLTLIGANAPTREVIGGTWYNTTTSTLYLCTSNGWTLLASTVGVDLAGLAIDSNLTDGAGNAVNIPAGTSTANQEDYNVWLYQNLTALQTTVSTSSANIKVQDTAPSSGLSIGNLWYKSADNTLYVWDAESGTNQWLRAVPALTDDTNFTTLQSTVTTNNNTHTTAVAACNTRIDNLTYAPLASPTFTGTVTGPTINASTALKIGGTAITSTAVELNILDGVTSTTAELNILDGVTATTAELNILDGVTATTTELNILDGVTATTTELNILDGVTATTAELNYVDGVTSNIQTQLNTKAPLASPTFTGAPTVPGYATLANPTFTGSVNINRASGEAITKFKSDGVCELYYNDSKKFETTNTGVTVTGALSIGSLPINNTDTATVGVDFSASIAATTKAFKFISNHTSANYVTWGNTSASWEYAYDFGSNEDFCWIYDNSGSPQKVFSVSKDGPACTNLTIADFSANNSSGRVLSNTIDVKDRLTKHKTALIAIRTACNDASITTVAALKTAIASALTNV